MSDAIVYFTLCLKPMNATTAREGEKRNPNPVLLPTCADNECFLADDIVAVKADKKCTLLLVKQGCTRLVEKVVFSMISDIEKRLPENDFVRVHRSHIVNKRKIHRYENRKKDGLVWLEGETKPVPVSRTYKKALLLALEKVGNRA
jgi:LytTr DNA-binding domain